MSRPGIQSLEWLALFYGLGGVILILVTFVLGRLSGQSWLRSPARRAATVEATNATAAASSAVDAEALTGEIRWEGTAAPA